MYRLILDFIENLGQKNSNIVICWILSQSKVMSRMIRYFVAFTDFKGFR